MTRLIHDRADFLAARTALDGADRIAVVMTMGALHEGHRRLLDTARADCDQVIATVFVNPLQFGPAEDYDRYPRTLDADLAVCTAAGADLVWAPAVADVYPHGLAQVRVDPGPLGAQLEGASRPGHFAGMLTVVLKFLRLTRPHVAYYGQKDYQQLTLIGQMAQDFELGVTVTGVPTVREPDGLAMSSRNRYLDPHERALAAVIPASLAAAQKAALSAAQESAILVAATEVLASAPEVDLDYLALRSDTLGPFEPGRPGRLLIAARIGRTRLIDNVPVDTGTTHRSDTA